MFKEKSTEEIINLVNNQCNNFTEEELKGLLLDSYDFVQEHPEIILTKSKDDKIHISIDYLYDLELDKNRLFTFICGYKYALVYRELAKL